MRVMLRTVAAAVCVSWGSLSHSAETNMSQPLTEYVNQIVAELDEVPPERQEVLAPLADFVAARIADGKTAEVTAICTANSRRSQFTQTWAHTAAVYYKLDAVRAYSSGTKATACNPRTVAALKRAGFVIDQVTLGENPEYELRLESDGEPLKLWSKTIDDPTNSQAGFAALMCCSSAAEACPRVDGASLRVPLLYNDPKQADGTPEEAAAYDERCRQIAREMFWVMRRAAEAATQ